MAISPSDIAAVARAYLRQIARGVSPASARSYALTNFGQGVPPSSMNYIVGQANISRQVGMALGQLDPEDMLFVALNHRDPPSLNVGINTTMHVVFAGGREKDITIYVQAQWHDTIADVQNMALDAVRRIIREGSDPISATITGYGPTLWDVPSNYLQFQRST